MRRRWLPTLMTLTAAVLACSVPPEVLDALNRLPTPAATATPVPSALLYVSKTGDDDNDCTTAATACLTIMAALEKAADGAAIHIGPGTYAENDFRTLDTAVAIRDQNVTLIGAASTGRPTTVITGSGELYPVYVSGDSRVVIENVGLANGTFGLFVVGPGTNVTLRHAEIRDNAMAAVNVGRATTAVLEDVLVTDNPEGAVTNGGDLTFRGSRIAGNGTLQPELGLGAGVLYNGGTLRLIDSTIAGSRSAAEEHPNVITNAPGASLRIERSTTSGNRVGRGAAVYNPIGGTAALVNSTVSGNSGVGITSLGDLNLTFSTVTGNGLSGMYGNASEADPMTLRLENSIIENNGEQDCTFQLGHAIVFDRRGRNLSDGSCDFDYGGIFPRPPEGDFLLGPLADNGGTTQTHALLEGNRGIDAAESPCLATDQRGVGRPVGGGCDVGAYEFTFALTAATPAGTLVPVETPTPPVSEPLVTFIQNANCRKGPAGAYNVTTALELGVQTAAVGRNEPSTWWLVIVPSTDIQCWVSGVTVETAGDVSNLPVVPVDPVPGAPGNFQVAKATCSANLNNYPVKLEWSDVSGETGYRLYRDGSQLGQVGANATSYSDEAPKGKGLTYEIEAFSALGVSERRSLSVPVCQ